MQAIIFFFTLVSTISRYLAAICNPASRIGLKRLKRTIFLMPKLVGVKTKTPRRAKKPLIARLLAENEAVRNWPFSLITGQIMKLFF